MNLLNPYKVINIGSVGDTGVALGNLDSVLNIVSRILLAKFYPSPNGCWDRNIQNIQGKGSQTKN